MYKLLVTPAEKNLQGRWDKSEETGWISVDRRRFYSHIYNTRSVLSRLQKIYVDDNLELRLIVKMELFRSSPLYPSNLISYVFSFITTKTLLSSMDSDLEAFSHNPTDGSFTALADQLTVFTNYLNQRFLSY